MAAVQVPIFRVIPRGTAVDPPQAQVASSCLQFSPNLSTTVAKCRFVNADNDRHLKAGIFRRSNTFE